MLTRSAVSFLMAIASGQAGQVLAWLLLKEFSYLPHVHFELANK